MAIGLNEVLLATIGRRCAQLMADRAPSINAPALCGLRGWPDGSGEAMVGPRQQGHPPKDASALRHARPRPHASHRRPHRRPDPGRHGRRRDQGRAIARRAFPPAFRRRLGAVDEPQQARAGRRPAHRGRARGADAAGAQGRCLHGSLHAGRDRQAGLRLGDAQQGEPAADLCLGLGLRPDRPLLQPRRLRSLHPGRDRPDGCDRSRRRRDVPRRHGCHRLLDRLVLRRRHRLRPAGAPQDRPRPAPRPVAVRCRHAPDEPLDHQPRTDRRGPHPHGHLELDHLSIARVSRPGPSRSSSPAPTTPSGRSCAPRSAGTTGSPTSASPPTPIASPTAPSSSR